METIRAIAESSAGEWAAILSLVFGGCCSNVWALEAVLKSYPASGTFLTFAQFLYVTVQTLPSQIEWDGWTPRRRKTVVPLSRWMVQVVLFVAVSLMNNYAFGLKIPITVHIIFRSGGLCVSMLVGYFLAGKRYALGQVVAGVVITIGIVLATVSAPRPPRAPSSPSSSPSAASEERLPESVQYVVGIGMLSMALFLSAWLGLWQEKTYRRYGNQWREALFFTHFLSLPCFVPFAPSLLSTFKAYASTAPVKLLTVPLPSIAPNDGVKWAALVVPSALLALAVNVVTQGLCIRGVNRLTSRVSSTTVNLILTLRKAVSLAISVWYYGSGASAGLVTGGAMVLGGTVIYSMASPPRAAAAADKKFDDDEDRAKHAKRTSAEVQSTPNGAPAEHSVPEQSQSQSQSQSREQTRASSTSARQSQSTMPNGTVRRR